MSKESLIIDCLIDNTVKHSNSEVIGNRLEKIRCIQLFSNDNPFYPTIEDLMSHRETRSFVQICSTKNFAVTLRHMLENFEYTPEKFSPVPPPYFTEKDSEGIHEGLKYVVWKINRRKQ